MINTVYNAPNSIIPLVNTPVPGSLVTRVPYYNVAPSVSSAQIDPNARGNNSGYEAVKSMAAESPVQEEAAPARMAGNFQTLPSVFLTQLMVQEMTPQTQRILALYERLVSFSNVKFKPSNALKPAQEPSSLFGRLLQQERASEPPPAAANENNTASPATMTEPVFKLEIQATQNQPPQASIAYAASVARQLPDNSAIGELA